MCHLYLACTKKTKNYSGNEIERVFEMRPRVRAVWKSVYEELVRRVSENENDRTTYKHQVRMNTDERAARSIWVENRTPTVFTRMLMAHARAHEHSVGDKRINTRFSFSSLLLFFFVVSTTHYIIVWPFASFVSYVCVCVCGWLYQTQKYSRNFRNVFVI